MINPNAAPELSSAGRRGLSHAARTLTLAAIALAALAVAITGCAGTSPGPALEVHEAWARPSLAPTGGLDDDAHHSAGGATSAAYFILRNNGGEADRLIAARTEVAAAVELHLSAIEDGIMRMRQVDEIEVAAGGEARLEPGGYHLMLIGLNRQLQEGQRFEIVLDFEHAGERTIEVEVGVRDRTRP